MNGAVAPGRAVRLRIRHRLASARRASQLLESKRNLLAAALVQVEADAARTAAEWEETALQAAAWLGRAASLDGMRGLTFAEAMLPAQVQVNWISAMGVRYPHHTAVMPSDDPVPAGSSALFFAVQAHRLALASGVRHAAAQRAVLALRTELRHTRTRQRAVDHRWIPRLEGELRYVEAQLDEMDREENLRMHWVVSR